ELLMRADRDPLLVAWRYGLGRVVAFTSDLSGRWGQEWVDWSAFPQWASQISRDAMRKTLGARMRADLRPEGAAIKIVTDLATREGNFLNHLKLKANVTAPNGDTAEKMLRQTAPGRYEGEFTPIERGIHFVTVYAEGNGTEPAVPVATMPHISPYPKEY